MSPNVMVDQQSGAYITITLRIDVDCLKLSGERWEKKPLNTMRYPQVALHGYKAYPNEKQIIHTYITLCVVVVGVLLKGYAYFFLKL